MWPPLRLALGAVLCVSMFAGVAAGQGQEASLADRIVAVVDEDPILDSDIDRVVAFGLETRQAGEAEADFRRRVMERLIEERLRSHEIDRHGFQELPLEEVNRAYEELRSQFASEAEFERRVEELGLTEDAVREILARQLLVLVFVEERLGPRVFVSLDSISEYYETTLVPEMRRQGQPVPELSAVREQIRAVLREQRLNQEVDLWTEELEFKADVVRYLDDRPTDLPPAVDIP